MALERLSAPAATGSAEATPTETPNGRVARLAIHRRIPRRIPPRLRMPLVVYAVTQVGFLFWWVALYPGQLTWDSVTYTLQVTTGNWGTDHSVVYSVLVWLSLQAVGGFALLTFVQTVAMAAAIAYTVTGLRSLGVPGRWLAIAAMVIPLFPSLGIFTVYVSKDVPFVVSQILLVGTLARIVVHRRRSHTGSWIRDPRMRMLLWVVFAELLGLALFRQNGQLVALGAALVAAVLLAGLRGWLVLAGVAAAGASLLLNLVVFPAVGVKTANSSLLLGPAYADIAMIYKQRPAVFTAAERQLMSTVAPLSSWRDNATCASSDPTTNNIDLNAAAANSSQLFDLWVRLIKRAPDLFIDARMCRGSIAWNVKTGRSDGTRASGTLRIAISNQAAIEQLRDRMPPDNPYRSAIAQAPLNDAAFSLAVFLRRATGSATLTPVIWRGALWCYIAYLAVLVFARRRDEWAVVALIGVALANQVVVLVNNPAQLVRYMMGPIFIGILLVPLLFVARKGAISAWPRERPATAGGAAEPAPASTRRPPDGPAPPPPAPPAAALRQADTHPIPPGAPDSIDDQQSSVMERREANTGSASAAERHNKVFEDS